MNISFKRWLRLREGAVTYNYDREAFTRLPWNWQAMQRSGVVQPMYFYVQGEEEYNDDGQFSIITKQNLEQRKQGETFSFKNLHSGNLPDQATFIQNLKDPQHWYDDKIDQVYNSIQMVGKRPEDFGGKDIRQNSQNS